MKSYLLASENSAVSGFINSKTLKCTLAKNENNIVYGIKFYEYYWKNTGTYWYWKIDESILDAQKAYEDRDMGKAETLFEIAIKNNPKHLYLQDQLKHIKYVLSNSTEDLEKQHKAFSGSYGPREFWLENNKFYYKRKGEKSDLPKVELLPLNENTYIDLSRLGTSMRFVEDESGKLASQSIQYNPLDETSTISDKSTTNYFLKDDE